MSRSVGDAGLMDGAGETRGLLAHSREAESRLHVRCHGQTRNHCHVAKSRFCRVGPGNFTPSPSQIRTGYSRIIRLVPSHEGCRLPLNEGLVPANQLAHISGDDPSPSLQSHYRTFVAVGSGEAPIEGLASARRHAADHAAGICLACLVQRSLLRCEFVA